MQIEQNTNAIEQNTSDIDDLVQAEVYSTSEVKTNKKWIDGKPIYRKVINTTLGSDGNWNTIINGNIEEVINLFGSFNATGQRYVIPRSYNGQSVTFYCGDGALYEMHNYAYANNRDAIIIIDYTKTTD